MEQKILTLGIVLNNEEYKNLDVFLNKFYNFFFAGKINNIEILILLNKKKEENKEINQEEILTKNEIIEKWKSILKENIYVFKTENIAFPNSIKELLFLCKTKYILFTKLNEDLNIDGLNSAIHSISNSEKENDILISNNNDNKFFLNHFLSKKHYSFRKMKKYFSSVYDKIWNVNFFNKYYQNQEEIEQYSYLYEPCLTILLFLKAKNMRFINKTFTIKNNLKTASNGYNDNNINVKISEEQNEMFQFFLNNFKKEDISYKKEKLFFIKIIKYILIIIFKKTNTKIVEQNINIFWEKIRKMGYNEFIFYKKNIKRSFISNIFLPQTEKKEYKIVSKLLRKNIPSYFPNSPFLG